jgi:hypothetical protein
MPVNVALIHTLSALKYIVDVEPRFKADFAEKCTEDGSDSAIAESLNDDEIEHVWKSAFIGLAALEGYLELKAADVSIDEEDGVEHVSGGGNLD